MLLGMSPMSMAAGSTARFTNTRSMAVNECMAMDMNMEMEMAAD